MRSGGNGQPQAYHGLLAAFRGAGRTEHLRAGIGKENRGWSSASGNSFGGLDLREEGSFVEVGERGGRVPWRMAVVLIGAAH